jgi:hypothetical protein
VGKIFTIRKKESFFDVFASPVPEWITGQAGKVLQGWQDIQEKGQNRQLQKIRGDSSCNTPRKKINEGNCIRAVLITPVNFLLRVSVY